MSTQQVQIASGTGAVVGLASTARDALAAAFGSPSAVAKIIAPQLYAAERNEPDGTQMQVVFSGFTGPFGGSLAGSAASKLNAAWLAGKIMDPATGEQLKGWPGASMIATGDDSTATLTVRWVRGQIWIVYLLWAMAGALAIYFLYSALRHSHWAVSILSALNPTNPQGLGGAKLFGVPLYLWAGGAAAAVIVPFGEERLSVYERAKRSMTGRA